MKDIVAYIGIILSIVGSMVVLYRLIQEQLTGYEELFKELLEIKISRISEKIEEILKDSQSDNSLIFEELTEIKENISDIQDYLSLPLSKRWKSFHIRKNRKSLRN